METYLSFWVRKNLQSLSRKRFSSLHLFDIENNLLSEHKFNELMKKSHTVLSVTTRNIPGREIPDPHPIVMPSKMATCINAHKIFIQVLNEESLKVQKNTKKSSNTEESYCNSLCCDNIHKLQYVTLFT